MTPGPDPFQHRVVIWIVGVVMGEVLDVHPIAPFVLIPLIITGDAGPERNESQLLGSPEIALMGVVNGFLKLQEAQILG